MFLPGVNRCGTVTISLNRTRNEHENWIKKLRNGESIMILITFPNMQGRIKRNLMKIFYEKYGERGARRMGWETGKTRILPDAVVTEEVYKLLQGNPFGKLNLQQVDWGNESLFFLFDPDW